MGLDLSKWIKNDFLADYIKDTITMKIEDFSEKYDIIITLKTEKKKDE